MIGTLQDDMADTIYLHGSEDVSRAGYSIKLAADDMNRAAAYLEGALERHQRFMDDWLNRFTQALENTSLKEKAGPTEAGSGEPTRFPSIHLRRLRASEKEAREELRRSRESEDMLRKALEQIRKMIPE